MIEKVKIGRKKTKKWLKLFKIDKNGFKNCKSGKVVLKGAKKLYKRAVEKNHKGVIYWIENDKRPEKE